MRSVSQVNLTSQHTMLGSKRVAVIGSNSFAGAAMVRRLVADGSEVIGFNRSAEGSSIFLQYRWAKAIGSYQFIQADINRDFNTIEGALRDFQPHVVADFAGQGMVAESWSYPDQWYTTNIVAKVRLHEVLRTIPSLGCYVRVSTPEVYGNTDTLLPETWNFNPSTPYAVSHAAIDMSLRVYHQHYGFPVIFTRFANFFGPGQQLYRIIPRAIIFALLKRKLLLQGGGKSVRAFIFGDDAVDGMVRAALNGVAGQTYHFSPQQFYTIREVVAEVAKCLDVKFADLVELGPDRPSKDHAYFMDSARARRELGWAPKVDLISGIQKTVEWVRSNFDDIKRLPLDYNHKV